MAKSYSAATLALVAENGIPPADLPLIINGCSGGFSAVYRLMFGRAVSCEECCDLHDLRYQLGGDAAARRAADVELRECAGRGGGWRRVRAWVMYAAVRGVGWLYWAG